MPGPARLGRAQPGSNFHRWHDTAYNQPPHPSFFIGDGMSTPNSPNIYVR
ncbi:hypothetical protein [Catellatospora sichuanensis]